MEEGTTTTQFRPECWSRNRAFKAFDPILSIEFLNQIKLETFRKTTIAAAGQIWRSRLYLVGGGVAGFIK